MRHAGLCNGDGCPPVGGPCNGRVAGAKAVASGPLVSVTPAAPPEFISIRSPIAWFTSGAMGCSSCGTAHSASDRTGLEGGLGVNRASLTRPCGRARAAAHSEDDPDRTAYGRRPGTSSVDGQQVLTAAVAGCRNRKGAFVYGSCRIALAVFGRAQGNAIIRRDTLCDWSLFARRRCALGGRQLGIIADLTLDPRQ